MTDNFNNIREFLKSQGLQEESTKRDDTYYTVELIRRGKDNPDLPAANMHFRNYYVTSLKSLDTYREEISAICTLLRLRAYISVNRKSFRQVMLDTLAETARRIAVHDYKKPYAIYESCSGKYAEAGNGLWVVYVDTKNEDEIAEIARIVNECTSSHKYETNVIAKIPTRSGVHLITCGFNRKEFSDKVTSLGKEVPDIKKNHLTLLYENLDQYK